MNSKRKTVFKRNRLTAAVMSALLAGQSVAGPIGGQVVGGSGSISQTGATTTINQSTQNMAINWQSYNVNVDERVQYIQPNSSSISLNRILSNNGSTIAGRIDANGQVILVNPNGVFFTPTSVVNVGGIIASGLDIAPSDFMNGNYIFNEVLGTEGKVINSGTINASLGGNVALIGKQVENDGLIVANLGTVSLAAGKQAVLTFDNGGLLGVRVSEAILQDELGVDPAVVNSGEIHSEGGRVLLTASVSQDVFSQAVNTAGLDQATSVVVNEDGSFTLGGGADVVNSGTIDTSTKSSDQGMGRIVL
jgi:filamentous hemagglutinin family protein